MPPRLRSKPYGPNSPNAAQGLPEPTPRRRRATRSASAQPQEDQPAPSARAPTTRKTRGKTASRGKKKATRQASPSPHPPTPPPDQSAVEQTRPELETQEQFATPSVEIPVTVLPSIEPSDPELPGPPEFRRFPSFIERLYLPRVSFFSTFPRPSSSERSSPVDPVASLPNESPSSTPSISSEGHSNQYGSWFMSKFQSFYRSYTRSHGASATSAATVTAPAVRWSLNIPILNLNMGHGESALDDIELMSIIRAARTAGTVPNRRSHPRPGTSPSPPSEQSRVLRAQAATPIRRSRTSFANRSTSRRIAGRGSLGRTLYRLPQLLSLSNRPELQDGSGEETNVDEQDSLHFHPMTSVPEATPPSTPKRATNATPVAPMTAPAAGTDVSPGWSRWIFNGVSRRWTVLRGRFTHDHENEDENQQADAEPVLAAPVTTSKTTPAVVPGSSVSPKAQRMAPLLRGTPPSSSLGRVAPLPRPRRRSMSFVDARTLLAADGSPSSSEAYSHETQREFVKRRQAARLVIEKQKQEAKNREITAAQFAAAAAAAAAHEAARLKIPAVSIPQPLRRPSPAVSRKPVNQAPQPTTAPPIDTGSLSRASGVAAAQTANPRKRNRGFGLDEEDLAIHESDFTPEEWATLKAEVEKAEEEAAKAAQECAPPTKKRRIDQTPKQQKCTPQSARRQGTTPRQMEPPSRTPGFIPNRRGTLAPPELSPIDSSRLLTDPDSPSVSPAPRATTGMIYKRPKPELPSWFTDPEWRRRIEQLKRNFNSRPVSSRRQRDPREAPPTPLRLNTANDPSVIAALTRSVVAEVEVRRREREALQADAEDMKKPNFGYFGPSAEQSLGMRLFRPSPPPPRAPPRSVRFAEPLEISRSTEAFIQAASSPVASPRLPTLPRHAIKRKWTFEAADPSPPSQELSSLPRPVKRSRTFEAPDSWASSSSSSPKPPSPLQPPKRKWTSEAPDPSEPSLEPSSPPRAVKRSRIFEAPDHWASSSSSSAPPASTASRSPYDVASYFASLRPQPHSPEGDPTVGTDADSHPHPLAAIQDSEHDTATIESRDPSPLSRARNQAELFKPKTPSRLRESTRIPNSAASTKSTLGLSSPSFNASETGTGASATAAAALNTSETAVNDAVPSLADDVAWLSEILPNGNFDKLQWPQGRRLVEVLNICPEADAIMEPSWPEKGTELVRCFEDLFEAYRAAPDEIVVAL